MKSKLEVDLGPSPREEEDLRDLTAARDALDRALVMILAGSVSVAIAEVEETAALVKRVRERRRF